MVLEKWTPGKKSAEKWSLGKIPGKMVRGKMIPKKMVGEDNLPWAIPCLGPDKYFSPYAYCFIFKSDLLKPNFFEKNPILYCFSWKVNFSMSKVSFWIFGFIETKRLNIDSFTNENWNKFKCHWSKVSRRKEKKNCCY